MRVAIDATPLIGPGTGVATFVRGLLGALSGPGGPEFHPYALSFRGRAALPAMPADGGRQRSIPMPAGVLTRVWRHLPVPPIEWWTGAVDVVHGTNFVVPPARRAASVVTVHDLTSVRFPELCTPATLRYPALIRRALARGAHVHTISAAVAEEVIELLGAPADRVHPVHLGITPVTTGDPARGRRLCGAPRYILALGTVEPRKDLPTLVAAFDLLAAVDPELHLVVAGPDGWGADALRAAAAASHHGGRMHRVGFVDGGDRADLLAGAAVLAYPSIYEGFGLPPLEAMSAGVPVVASTAGALREVLGEAAVLVAPGDPEALAEAINGVLSDDDRRVALIGRGRARSAEFTWERCGAAIGALYEHAAASR